MSYETDDSIKSVFIAKDRYCQIVGEEYRDIVEKTVSELFKKYGYAAPQKVDVLELIKDRIKEKEAK